MKKKLILILVLTLAVVMTVVGTVAYFNATDAVKNAVAVGNASIELVEFERANVNDNNTDNFVTFKEENKLLLPSIVSDDFDYKNLAGTVNWKDENGNEMNVGGNKSYTSSIWNPAKINNELDKMVFVRNTGNTDVYVRVCFAFEAGNYVYKSHFDRMVHLNKNDKDWTWNWGDEKVVEINGTRYFIAWATYDKPLPGQQYTEISLSQIALDSSAIGDHAKAFGDKYDVLVFAQGIQVEGMGGDAAAALNKGFGETIPFGDVKEVNFVDLKTALHYLNADKNSEANKITSNVTSVTFGLTADHSAKVVGREGVLVANLETQADFTAYAYYVPNGENYDIYVLADDWKIYAPNNSDSLFAGMGSLKKVGTEIFDVSNVTKASHMFDDCSQLVTLDTSGWRFPNVTTTEEMFDSCSQLTVLDTSAWYLPKVTTMKRMFVGCKNLLELDVADWGITSNLNNIYSIFDWCNALTTLDCSNWDVSGVGDMSYAFRHCIGLTNLDVSYWEVGKVSSFWSTFANCSNLTTIPVDTWTWDGDPGQNATVDMRCMFSGCTSLTALDLSGWDVGKVTKMNYMFSDCTSLTSVNVGGWNVGKVSTITNMFNGCYKLSDLDLSSWKFVNVSDMKAMFQNCFSLKTIDLSGWDMGANTSNIDMEAMFKMEIGKDGYGSSELATIYVNKSWTNTKISSSHQMFLNCGELKGGGTPPTSYDSNNIDFNYAHIDGNDGKPGYLTQK